MENFFSKSFAYITGFFCQYTKRLNAQTDIKSRPRARCLPPSSPYREDIEKYCFILMAFLGIVNCQSDHIGEIQGSRDLQEITPWVGQ